MKNAQARRLTLLTLTIASLLGMIMTPTSRRVGASVSGAVTRPVIKGAGGVRREIAATAAQPAAAFTPMTVTQLKDAINTANSNNADDVIDLGGQTFTLTAADNTTVGLNGLPVIESDNGHRLVIENGRVERSTAGGTEQFRLLYISNGANLTLSRVTIANGVASFGNSAGAGGGLFNQGVLTLNNCTVTGNSSAGGGGILNQADDSAPTAMLTLNRCTISGNSSHGSGGGIANVAGGTGHTATLVVNNSTIAGNSGFGYGGGILNTLASGSTATMTLRNSTISGNSTFNGGGIHADGLASIGGCIIARNSADSGPDVEGGVTSQGYNLIGVASSGFNQPTDQNGVDPMLELDGSNQPLLKDNGGPTQTIALLCGSPAIDKGKNFTSATTDQRGTGFPRTFDNAPANLDDGTDIGAFEVQTACNQPPVARCQNVTVSAGANCTASASIDNGSSDPDGDAISLTQSPAGPYAKGQTLVTLTVTDSHNATSSCAATVRVVDNTAPTINCASVAAQSASTDGNCAATVPDVTGLVRAQSSDNCTLQANLVITQTPTANSTVSGAGSHPITVTVKDADNNSQTCVVGFTLNDTTKPTINCPANLTRDNDLNQCAAVVAFNPTASDNCSGVAAPVCTPPSGSSFPKGTTTVTCTVKDAANNQSLPCSFTVTVVDMQPPSIVPPQNISVPATARLCSAAVTYNAPAVSDNCPGVGAPICNPPSGTSFPKGTTTVNCSVKDAVNNQANAAFTVTVVDTQPPTIACPPNVIAATVNAGDATVAVSYETPSTVDNCGSVSVVCVPPSGSQFPRGTTTVTCTASDASNNQASCSFTVRVFDYVIVDDTNGKLVRFDSVTGDYDFFDCRKNKSLSGRGTVTTLACKTTLNHSAADRNVVATANSCMRVGSATVVYQGVTHTLSDANLSNNIVKCP